jgi:hypothetical protein
MAKSNTFENQWLKLIFNAVPIYGLADDAALNTVTDLYVALHTAILDDASTQATNEVTTTQYPGYQRVAVPRTTLGWTVTNSSVSPTHNIDFPACTGAGSCTATHFSIGTTASGANRILYYGAINPSIVISNNVVPRLTTASTITED